MSIPNSHHTETLSLLWAEAKRGKSDAYKSIAQPIPTIGKAWTFGKNFPPAFLSAFDAKKIAFIKGKLKTTTNGEIFDVQHTPRTTPLVFSAEATAVFDAGQKLWKDYQQQATADTNAILYDIRQYFQDTNDKGKMNNRNNDETYHQLMA